MKLSTFHIQIKDGNIAFKSDAHKAMFKRYLAQYEGMEVFMEINEKKVKRSGQQNSFYWLFLSVIEQETGHTIEELHSLFKGMFISEIKNVLGNNVRVSKTTTELTKSEFAEYIMKIEEYTGILAPDVSEALDYNYHK